MPEGYDHISDIHGRRAFARALAEMVTEQVGPRGTKAEMKTTINGEERINTVAGVQVVYHGPVIYVDNPYEFVTSATSGFEYIMRSIFVKGIERRDQREYRFVVWADDEPSEEIVDLDASLALLEAVEKPAEAQPEDSPDSEADPDEHGSVPLNGIGENEANPIPTPPPHPPLPDLIQTASMPVVPYPHSTTDLSPDIRKIVTTHSALEALHSAVRGWPPGDTSIEAASVGWHAEQCIRVLCSNFEDPIEKIARSRDSFVIITLKFPDDNQQEGRIVIGPQGTGSVALGKGLDGWNTHTKTGWLLGSMIADELEEAGLRRRLEGPEPASEELTDGS